MTDRDERFRQALARVSETHAETFRRLADIQTGPALTVEVNRENDGRWIAEIPELPGVLVYGATINGCRDRCLPARDRSAHD